MPDFFISRNKADKAWAVWIAWQLEAAGYSTVVQDWDFRAGSNFALEMHSAANAERTMAVLSPDFLKSEYTAPEWVAAFARDPTGAKRKLVPVRVRECAPSGLLTQIVYIDLVGLDEVAAKAKLLDEVKQRRAKPPKPPAFPGKRREEPPVFPGPKRPQRRQTATARGGNRSASRALGVNEIATRIDRHGWGARPDRRGGGWTGDVWLGAVIVPDQQGGPYIDVLELDGAKLRDQVVGLAFVGSSAIFRASRRTIPVEQPEHLAFEQHDDRTHGLVAALEVHTDGTLVYRAAVERRAAKATGSVADSCVIDEDAVRRAIAAFVAFANGFYRQRRRDPGNLHLGLSLGDIAFKHFGRLPTYEVTSFMIGDPRLDDPLRVPTTPLTITKAQLAKPDAVAKTAVEHIARAFRLAGAYYTP